MFNPLKLAEMMSKAGEVQEQVQQQMAQTMVEGSSGGGAVNVTMNGKKQLMKLKIDPSAVVGLASGQPDVEMLEDLIVAAVNDAGRKAEEIMVANMKGLLGGLKLPGLD